MVEFNVNFTVWWFSKFWRKKKTWSDFIVRVHQVKNYMTKICIQTCYLPRLLPIVIYHLYHVNHFSEFSVKHPFFGELLIVLFEVRISLHRNSVLQLNSDHSQSTFSKRCISAFIDFNLQTFKTWSFVLFKILNTLRLNNPQKLYL